MAPRHVGIPIDTSRVHEASKLSLGDSTTLQFPLCIDTVGVVAPLEQPLDGLLAVGLVRSARVLGGERPHPRVRLIGPDVGGVAVLAIPEPPIEHVHPMAPRLDRPAGVALALLGGLAEREQPLEAVAPLGAIVDQLSFVEVGRRGFGHERDAVDRVGGVVFTHLPVRRIR